MNVTIAIIFALIVIVLAVIMIWRIRTRHFKPAENKLIQQKTLNQDLEPTGFAYQLQDDYFYSLMDCWQRSAGYCELYDEGAPLFNMIMDCEPIRFSYAGKRWLIELWKGQYGITTGAEIGVYNTGREDINTEKFNGTFYESIRNEERLHLAFVLRKRGKVLMRREGIHWWLTGFKLGKFSSPHSLTMDAQITFPNQEMCSAFAGELRTIGYRKKEYKVRGNTVSICYKKPHSPQTFTRNKVQESFVQQTNKNNCKAYRFITKKYPDTLDKIEYLKAGAPELYDFFLHSLYARGFFEAFGWKKEIIHGGHHKDPIIPKPPCPPEPQSLAFIPNHQFNR